MLSLLLKKLFLSLSVITENKDFAVFLNLTILFLKKNNYQ